MSGESIPSTNGHRAPETARAAEPDLLASARQMTAAIGQIESALGVLQRHTAMIAKWSSDRPDLSGSTRDLGAILLGASQAALDQRAEIEAERERILASARQMAQAIISEAEARARAIVDDARRVPESEQSRPTTMPRVDATMTMPTIPAAASTEAMRVPINAGAADTGGGFIATPEKEPPRLDPTLMMPKAVPPRTPDEAAAPPSSSGVRRSRAANLLATLDQITEANAALADDIATVAEH